MPNPNRIRAHLTSSNNAGYAKAKTKSKGSSGKDQTFYYMFTGGYWYDASQQTIGQPTGSIDDGPAGEIALNAAASEFTIDLVDDTGKGFRITQWNLGKDGDLTGETFSPPPDDDLTAPGVSLTIDVANVPADEHGKYKGYFVTVTAPDGTSVELDPRIYDMR
jgi:hypothetical protein